MSELKLRGYQREALDAVFGAWAEGVKRPAVVLATGLGKTVIFAHLIKEFRNSYRHGQPDKGRRVIVLVHRDELADQAMVKIRSVAPGLSVGKVKAGDNDIRADVMVCSVQTLAVKGRRDQILGVQASAGNVGLIVTDECHHGAAASYRKVYDAFPDALQLGVTATLARGDGVGLGGVWDEVVYAKSSLWGMHHGYLAPVRGQRVQINGLDMSGVKSSRGDWQAGDLGRVLEETHADEAIARAYVEHAKDRPGVVFTPTVATAVAAAGALNDAGIATEVISGDTSREERTDIFRRYREGSVQVLANCMVLTEGFDAPWASCAVIARPTQSNPLYIQMVGRVLRPWPGKVDALVLDVVGASASNKLQTLINLDPTVPVHALRDGETLEDAVLRETDEAGMPATPGSVVFDLKSKEVDLFAGTTKAWLITPRGVMFIDCGDTTVFLWPDADGAMSVCTVAKGDKWRVTEHRGLDVSTALAWGEVVAEDTGSFSVSKKASWRRTKPSDAQLRLADRLGINAAGLSKGELGDRFSLYFATEHFDPYVGHVTC